MWGPWWAGEPACGGEKQERQNIQYVRGRGHVQIFSMYGGGSLSEIQYVLEEGGHFQKFTKYSSGGFKKMCSFAKMNFIRKGFPGLGLNGDCTA